MRVVAGEFRGRKLVAPETDRTRPTTDKVREAVFNALTSLDLLVDATVADLYAGSGALGIEALSRGAAHCTFVEKDRAALSAIHANIGALGVTGRTRVVSGDALVMSKGLHVDVAFADPPYGFDDWPALLASGRGRFRRRRVGCRGGRAGRLGADAGQALRPDVGVVPGPPPSRRVTWRTATPPSSTAVPTITTRSGNATARTRHPTRPATAEHPRPAPVGAAQRQRRGIGDRVVHEDRDT